MPRLIPTKPKDGIPEETLQTPDTPEETPSQSEVPKFSVLRQQPPEESELKEEIPEESKEIEEVPEPTPEKEEKPSGLNEENCVIVGGQKIEIKPTKLKYFRNKAASAYGIIKAVPLHELLTYDKGVLDPKRDADMLLFDFLVAAFDDSKFVTEHYDDIDAATVNQIVKILGRINGIDEKEEAARKNKEAQAQQKR